MSRELCLIHANCQGDSLRSLLEATPAFGRCFETRKYTNYLKESIPQQDFDRCRVFLYQHLGEKWNDQSSDALLARLHPVACPVKIPNLLFKGYWPLWTSKSAMNYGDMLLDLLVSRGYSESDVLHVYLRGRLTEKYNLNAILNESLFRERQKEKGAVIALAGFIEENWRTQRLFLSPNHPDKTLLLAAADAVLESLGLGRVPLSLRNAFTPDYPDFELPIHPQVGAHFGLPFVSAGRLYSIYGRPMSFARYVACYVHCLSRRLGNFEVFLHQVSAA
jgi:hypothetical protein